MENNFGKLSESNIANKNGIAYAVLAFSPVAWTFFVHISPFDTSISTLLSLFSIPFGLIGCYRCFFRTKTILVKAIFLAIAMMYVIFAVLWIK